MVTDTAWMIRSLHALAWMIPGEVAVFSLDQIEDAKQWAAAG